MPDTLIAPLSVFILVLVMALVLPRLGGGGRGNAARRGRKRR